MSVRRVVVTGLGIVCPVADNISAFADALKKDITALQPVCLFDTSPFRVKMGGEITELSKVASTNRSTAAMSVDTQRARILGTIAAQQAVESADLESSRESWAVAVGTASSEMSALEELYLRSRDATIWERPKLGACVPSLLASQLSADLELEGGPTATLSSACSAGTSAIGTAFHWIRDGVSDLALAGGLEPLSEMAFAGFNSVHSLTTTLCRPFDETRDGMFVSEGAAFMVLEDRGRALRRGARIRGEVVGYGLSADAYHMTAPTPDGSGLARAILHCLAVAGLRPQNIGYINAHGTGTAKNDPAELAAIRTAFGDYASDVPISSIKGLIGHSLGACGAIEAVACILSMEEGFIPFTVGLENPIKEFASFDLVRGAPRQARLDYALSLSAAFGGLNAVIALASSSYATATTD